MPRVSVIIPAYNRSEFFPLVVDTLIAQTFPDWEAVVVDDGSEPEHLAAIEDQCARDGRIRFFQRQSEKGGAPVARNEGFAHSTGEYILFLDADDALHPECLADRVRIMDALPELDFGISMCLEFREKPGDTDLVHNVPWGMPDLQRFFRLDVPWQTTSSTWRRGALERLGPWDEALPSWQDWEYHVRALALGFKYQRIAGGISYWRLPGSETIGKKSFSPPHLQAQLDLYSRTVNLLIQQSRFDQPLCRATAGLFLNVAFYFVQAGETAQGLAAWKRAYREGYIDGFTHVVGALCIRFFKNFFLGKLFRWLLRECWPPGIYPRVSQTAFVTPLSQIGNLDRWYIDPTVPPKKRR